MEVGGKKEGKEEGRLNWTEKPTTSCMAYSFRDRVALDLSSEKRRRSLKMKARGRKRR